jgi:hypothetical protein
MGKIDETRNFFDLYMHQVGTSEVPKAFHFWASMSLLAAAVGDRVWVEPDPGRKIYPNIYVFLIGPSGSGKEQAVMGAAKLGIHDPTLAMFMGRATRQFLLDYLTKDVEPEGGIRYVHNPHLYMVTEELGSAIRAGDLGHDLISFFTEYYTRKPIGQDGTRGTGLVTISDPCFNWLAGTTDEWLLRAVDRDAIEGGFFARVISIRGRRNYKERCPQIVYPVDRDEVRDYIRWRVSQYAQMKGGFTYTPEAQEAHDVWYMERAEPMEAIEEPAFNRADEMVFRLSLLLRLAEIDGIVDDMAKPVVWEPTITLAHFQEAVAMWDGLIQDLPDTIKKASATDRSTAVDRVGDMLKRLRVTEYSNGLRKAGNFGLDKDLFRSAVETLKERGELIEDEPVKTGGRPKRILRWVNT